MESGPTPSRRNGVGECGVRIVPGALHPGPLVTSRGGATDPVCDLPYDETEQ